MKKNESSPGARNAEVAGRLPSRADPPDTDTARSSSHASVGPGSSAIAAKVMLLLPEAAGCSAECRLVPSHDLTWPLRRGLGLGPQAGPLGQCAEVGGREVASVSTTGVGHLMVV